MKKSNTKSSYIGAAVAVGATVLAASAAAYLLFGKDGKKNQKMVRGWAVKMKGEIIEKLEDAKDVSEPVYHKIVDTIAARYAKAKNVDSAELAKAVEDIRKHWKVISKATKK